MEGIHVDRLYHVAFRWLSLEAFYSESLLRNFTVGGSDEGFAEDTDFSFNHEV
jgi:hypothetical protein